MPAPHVLAVSAGVKRPGTALAFVLALSGCMGGYGPDVTKFGFGAGTRPDQASLAPGGELARSGQASAQGSAIIGDLAARQSVLPTVGPYADVAQAVIEANAGPARAELRVARLRAEARSQNWLPTLSPTLSLTDLGEAAASLLLEQVLFDGGGRKAERAFAAADVEVAATTLSLDFNQRVFEGLGHYLRAQRALEQARLAETAVGRMAEFERIVGIRLEGGMSDRSEQQVIAQKAAEMRAKMNDDRFQAQQAMAELNAMSPRPLDGLSGLQPLPADPGAPEPLSVVKARAEAARMMAEADMARSGYAPKLTAAAAMDHKGNAESGLSVEFDNALGLGTGAALDAIAASRDVADRRVAQTAEAANRDLVALQQEIATLTAREAEGRAVLGQTEATLHMFTEQYKVGRRTLMELVNMFESYSAMEREMAGLKYEIALKRLQIARDRGVLVNGALL